MLANRRLKVNGITEAIVISDGSVSSISNELLVMRKLTTPSRVTMEASGIIE